MNGEPVGVWGRTQAGIDTFAYQEEWRDSFHGRPLSLTMPFLPGNETHSGAHVAAWFDNLLPDRPEIRARIARRFRINSNARSLLSEIGRECVGAVQLLPIEAIPEHDADMNTTALGNDDVARMLRGVTSSESIGNDDDVDEFRISIPGAQEKTALLRMNDQWHRPNAATPSTHILKLPLGLAGSMRYNMQHSVENEWLCLRLLNKLGFEVAPAEIATFKDAISVERVLIVERFDRGWSTDQRAIVRLPQEDFCQATGTPPTNKYEADGGPGISKSLQLLRAGVRPDDDVTTFILAQLAFWLLAATDGHAKNFSLFLRRDGHLMTPLYDVISAWPVIGNGPDKLPIQKARLSMALRGKNVHRELDRITTRHWRLLADQSGVRGAFEAMTHLVERVPDVLRAMEAELPTQFPAGVWNAIAKGIGRQCGRFLGGLSSTPD